MTRREMLLSSGVAFLASHATGAEPASGVDVTQTHRRQMHGGKGLLDVRFFFEPERPGRPALFLEYRIPPGASEGVHTHGRGRAEGPWDEYYYVAEGAGRMRVGDSDVRVAAGEALHAPLGVPHGIENTTPQILRIFLVAIERT
jgi:mannose-6-phosphate isomerase-like protein (cupin superfamily)